MVISLLQARIYKDLFRGGISHEKEQGHISREVNQDLPNYYPGKRAQNEAETSSQGIKSVCPPNKKIGKNIETI